MLLQVTGKVSLKLRIVRDGLIVCVLDLAPLMQTRTLR